MLETISAHSRSYKKLTNTRNNIITPDNITASKPTTRNYGQQQTESRVGEELFNGRNLMLFGHENK